MIDRQKRRVQRDVPQPQGRLRGRRCPRPSPWRRPNSRHSAHRPSTLPVNWSMWMVRSAAGFGPVVRHAVMADRPDAGLIGGQVQLEAVVKAKRSGEVCHGVDGDRPVDRRGPGKRAGLRQRRLFQCPGHLLGGAVVHVGMGRVRQGHVVPFLGREGGPGLHELGRPRARPRRGPRSGTPPASG